MEFKIPKKYNVGGQQITVMSVESDGGDYGNLNPVKGIIRICNNIEDSPQSESSKLNTFFHELTHSILRTMGEYELNGNEKFVNCFAGFLTEAITTMQGKL